MLYSSDKNGTNEGDYSFMRLSVCIGGYTNYSDLVYYVYIWLKLPALVYIVYFVLYIRYIGF